MLLRLVLLEPEEHLALKPVLELLSPHHGLQDPLDGPLRVLLLGEVLEDGVHRDLRPDSKALLQLLFDAEDGLLVLLGGETFSPGQIAGHGGRQSRNLNSKWGEYETMDAPDPSSELPGYPASLKEGKKKSFLVFYSKEGFQYMFIDICYFFTIKYCILGGVIKISEDLRGGMADVLNICLLHNRPATLS